MTKTNTGIVLRQYHKGGVWVLRLPGQTPQTFSPEATLNSIPAQVGLDAGYWLRAAAEADATVWTWVVL